MSTQEKFEANQESLSPNWEVMRGTGDFITTPYSEAEEDLWVRELGLPPRLEGELWHEWAIRTGKSRLEVEQPDPRRGEIYDD